MSKISIEQLLFGQGFGTRRVCAGLVQQGLVSVAGQVQEDAGALIEAQDGLAFSVDGQDWQYQSKAYVLLHKPAGYECSQKPSAWPSVYTLLPMPLRMRPSTGKQVGVQAVGRLDQDTTGLLLLTDDGPLLHRMASPKYQVPKCYWVSCKHAITEAQIAQLLAGVLLDGEREQVRAEHCELLAENKLALTITQGKYHQVKRMLAAVGNRVEQLHRQRVGAFELPADLQPGQWRWLTAAELALAQASI